MKTRDDNGHLSAERMQALLEGELPGRERRLAEEHLASCRRCASELAAWETLFSDLGDLPSLRPHEGFAGRVMARVEIPEEQPLAARLRDRARAAMGLSASGHVDEELVQDLVDGMLPSRHAARVRAHLEGCTTCAGEVERWNGVFRKLDALPRHAPATGFADRVMAQVILPVPATAPAAPAGLLQGWTQRAQRLVPRTRRAWAALSGAAVTPVVTLGLVVWAVFSHPTLTASALASFVWWQITDLAAAGWSLVSGALAQGAAAVGAQSALEVAASAPWALAGAALVYSVLVVLALRVLYRNLFPGRTGDISYAQISHS